MDGQDSLYQEAMFIADMYGIPKLIIDDYYEAFVQFVREELNNRVKKGMPPTKINTDVFFQVILAEADVC